MRTYIKRLLRWGAVAIFGSVGLWLLLEAGYNVIARWNRGFLYILPWLCFETIIAFPFLFVAYVCLRRQYRRVFVVIGVLGSIIIFSELISLPFQLGINETLESYERDNPWLHLIGVPVSLIFLFGPYLAAAAFFYFCYRFVSPYRKGLRVLRKGEGLGKRIGNPGDTNGGNCESPGRAT